MNWNMRSVSCGVKRFLSPLQGSPGPGALPRVPPFRLHPRLYSCRRFAAPEPPILSRPGTPLVSANAHCYSSALGGGVSLLDQRRVNGGARQGAPEGALELTHDLVNDFPVDVG